MSTLATSRPTNARLPLRCLLGVFCLQSASLPCSILPIGPFRQDGSLSPISTMYTHYSRLEALHDVLKVRVARCTFSPDFVFARPRLVPTSFIFFLQQDDKAPIERPGDAFNVWSI